MSPRLSRRTGAVVFVLLLIAGWYLRTIFSRDELTDPSSPHVGVSGHIKQSAISKDDAAPLLHEGTQAQAPLIAEEGNPIEAKKKSLTLLHSANLPMLSAAGYNFEPGVALALGWSAEQAKQANQHLHNFIDSVNTIEKARLKLVKGPEGEFYSLEQHNDCDDSIIAFQRNLQKVVNDESLAQQIVSYIKKSPLLGHFGAKAEEIYVTEQMWEGKQKTIFVRKVLGPNGVTDILNEVHRGDVPHSRMSYFFKNPQNAAN
jgi:hypothetical protein